MTYLFMCLVDHALPADGYLLKAHIIRILAYYFDFHHDLRLAFSLLILAWKRVEIARMIKGNMARRKEYSGFFSIFSLPQYNT